MLGVEGGGQGEGARPCGYVSPAAVQAARGRPVTAGVGAATLKRAPRLQRECVCVCVWGGG
jgi:hypothetical protein